MIADRIKSIREQNGLSQAQLARKLSVSRSSVNAWELGISAPTIQYVIEMARLFRVSTDYLLDVETEQKLTLNGLSSEEISILYSLVSYFDTDKN